MNTRQPPAIVIMGSDGHPYTLMRHQAMQDITRKLSTTLADLRRINPLKAQLSGCATIFRRNPQGIAICHRSDTRKKHVSCTC
jgi:hypothetical protein